MASLNNTAGDNVNTNGKTSGSISPKFNPLANAQDRQFRILVVDDESSITELLAFSLRREGYKVATASNGEDALKMMDEFSPDVMCIDYMMPKMDGQELARRIRARNDLLYVPIVMLTALSQDATRLASLDSGVDAFLTKPVSREELKVVIRTMLRIKVAQDNMLEALDRVAEVQDELLEYERRQGNIEAMRATIATYTYELAWPLEACDTMADKMQRLMEEAEVGMHTVKELAATSQVYLTEMRSALAQANEAMRRLNEANQFAIKEGGGHQAMLDLDKADSPT